MITQGITVRHGTPGYENVETIRDITDRGDQIHMTFESGFTTVMDSDDIQELVDEGEVQYMQWNSQRDFFTYESMMIA